MGRKILVAVDQSEESTHALSWCLKSLVDSRDSLVLLFAKAPLAVYSSTDSIVGPRVSSSIIATMEAYANEMATGIIQRATTLCKNLNDEVTVEAIVEHGDPRDVICEVAERLKVDFLVMGSHGYGLIQRAFLGSVSNHCAHNAKCPVLIVKMPKNK